ncbi:hypothetical protein [Desulfovibrio sp. ZJ200]|uniref:hypothetical protein n=1 Tax=Desulfovibrio sp. ZJ200 TaxID=2709792 RepID=UPI0013EDF9C4|nr:hypothetical protein [Desulfovibrio sp. ZJ200]
MKEDNILDIERVALDFLQKARKDAGLTEAEFGKRAFPESSNPWSKVHAMWNAKTATKKALRLRLGDFCSMCKALDKNPAQELLLLWNQVEQD